MIRKIKMMHEKIHLTLVLMNLMHLSFKNSGDAPAVVGAKRIFCNYSQASMKEY